MNTNKILFLLIIISIMIIPQIYVEASTQKTVSTSCSLNYTGSYSSNTCSQDILEDNLKLECRKGEFNDNKLLFRCTGNGQIIKGTSISAACDKIRNKYDGIVLTLSASDLCTTDDEIIGEFFCQDVKNTLRLIGFIIIIIKIIVPLLIILMGTIDYYKAIIDEKEDSMLKQTKVLIRRILIGLLIFFIPTLIKLGLMFIGGWSEVEPNYNECAECLLDPMSCN